MLDRTATPGSGMEGSHTAAADDFQYDEEQAMTEIAARHAKEKAAIVLNGLDLENLKKIVPNDLEHALIRISHLNQVIRLAVEGSTGDNGDITDDSLFAIGGVAFMAQRLAEAALGMASAEYREWEEKGARRARKDVRKQAVRAGLRDAELVSQLIAQPAAANRAP